MRVFWGRPTPQSFEGNTAASKTGWLYDLSRDIWKGYTATGFFATTEESRRKKTGGCITFPHILGKAIQPPGVVLMRGGLDLCVVAWTYV